MKKMPKILEQKSWISGKPARRLVEEEIHDFIQVVGWLADCPRKASLLELSEKQQSLRKQP